MHVAQANTQIRSNAEASFYLWSIREPKSIQKDICSGQKRISECTCTM